MGSTSIAPFLFEHWRASRYKVWSKYIQHQQSLNYDRKLLTTSGSRKLSTGNGSYHGSMGSICSDTASSDGPNSRVRKLSKIDIIHQMYYTHEKFSPKTCPTIITEDFVFETEAFPPRISGVLFQANSTDTTVVSECRVDRTCPVFASEELLVKLLEKQQSQYDESA